MFADGHDHLAVEYQIDDWNLRMSAAPVSVTANQILWVVTILLTVAGLWLACRRWWVRWQRRRKWSRARVAERRAADLLEQCGYEVMGAQVEASYPLIVDGEPVNVSLRADYIVARAGRYYVAEVKSGRVAPRLDTAATRRQLLEYFVAFQVDGALLVDGEARQVHEVIFPVSKQSAPRNSEVLAWLCLGALILVGAVIGILAVR